VLLPWNAVLTMFGFFDNAVAEYTKEHTTLRPDFIYPFAVNGLASVT
jgi:hypothetical protein